MIPTEVEPARTPEGGARSGETTGRPPETPAGGVRLRHEAIRKTIHVGTIALPVAVWFLPREASIGLLAFGAALALAIEAARRNVRWVRHAFLSRTRRLLRPRERNGLAGATYMAIAYLAAFLVFPKPVAVAAMLFNAVGDATAALVGKRWGRHRTTAGKSWEGAAAGFAANLAVGLAVPGLPVAATLAGAAAAAGLEMAPLPIDDNLIVTLGGGAALAAAVAML